MRTYISNGSIVEFEVTTNIWKSGIVRSHHELWNVYVYTIEHELGTAIQRSSPVVRLIMDHKTMENVIDGLLFV